jgi:hypothetical protein
MSRTAFFALTLAGLAAALSGGTASAGGYYGGGYGPSYYGGYAQPCCNYAPPPCCAAPAPYYAPSYPVAPAINWGEGPRYYSGYSNGYGTVATPCYNQAVRVLDGRGGWIWGVRSSCDSH